MAAEVDRLKARIADLERENDELQRKKPCYGFGSANPLTDPTFPSVIILQQQQHQAKLREQQISRLQIENTQVQKRAAVLKEKNETLQKRIENQEALLRLTDVCPSNILSGHEHYTKKTLQGFPLYNTKFNPAL
jgi:DNA repair exonuclease SbcCD ATPase subunit